MGKAENTKAIYRGFAKLARAKDGIIENGLYSLMESALDFLLEAHDVLHDGRAQNHPSENDTLGYAIIHNGRIVETVAQSRGVWTPRGDVLTRLQKLASSVTASWAGIVCSDMANHWYRVDWEEDFLMYSADMTADVFKQLFVPV